MRAKQIGKILLACAIGFLFSIRLAVALPGYLQEYHGKITWNVKVARSPEGQQAIYSDLAAGHNVADIQRAQVNSKNQTMAAILDEMAHFVGTSLIAAIKSGNPLPTKHHHIVSPIVSPTPVVDEPVVTPVVASPEYSPEAEAIIHAAEEVINAAKDACIHFTREYEKLALKPLSADNNKVYLDWRDGVGEAIKTFQRDLKKTNHTALNPTSKKGIQIETEIETQGNELQKLLNKPEIYVAPHVTTPSAVDPGAHPVTSPASDPGAHPATPPDLGAAAAAALGFDVDDM